MDALLTLFDLALVASAIRLVTPILLAALGGLFTQRVGIFNVALEGMMLFGAFFAVAGMYWTGEPMIALAIAVVAAVLVALLFAMVVVDFGGDAIVAGLAVNILALGLTTYLVRPVFGVQGSFYDPSLGGLPAVHLPLVEQLPLLGTLLSGHSPLVYLAFVLAIGAHVFLFGHPAGLRVRAVGENPVAAASVGINVRGTRYAMVLLSGALCGLAGAQLSISLVHQFVQGMTAGRGFIALVAVIFGRARPVPVLAASVLFGFAYALAVRLQGAGIPSQFVAMLPYLATIVVLVAVAMRARRSRQRAARAIDEAETVERP